MPEYSVKNIKTFRGMEDTGYNSTLYRDGKKVANADYEGNGGSVRIDWLDYEAPRVEIQFIDYQDNPATRMGTPEEKIFTEHLDSLPRRPVPDDWPSLQEKYPDGMRVDEDEFIGDLIAKFEDEKWLKRNCKTKTVCRIRGAGEGEYAVFKVPFNAETKAKILEHNDDIEEFMNERYL